MERIFLWLLVLVAVANVVVCDLSLSGTQCGTLTCKSHEYCSPFDRQCLSCVDICNKSHHNFQLDLCTKDCQDYIHDIRYVKTGLKDGTVDFGGDIKRVYTLATVALTLVCLVILGLLATVAFKVYRWSRKNSIKDFWNDLIKKPDESGSKTATTNNGGVTVSNGKADLRLEMPTSVVQSEMTPVTLTTSINSRRPAEDSALDYAYDNHGMSTGTPSPHSAKTARESNF